AGAGAGPINHTLNAETAGALARLDEITRRLRRECPWDREQDARSIVPHTVEEASELAEAAERGDDAGMLDELGDVLFGVVFLALLLEERGRGDLAAVIERLNEKLVRRHPHVFGDEHAETIADVRAIWKRVKAQERAAGEGP
ncbi:MAG: MazG nucleotide pyrophosphohydrolase domain-containing protein, partial [Solirubrobacterales bacterium]